MKVAAGGRLLRMPTFMNMIWYQGASRDLLGRADRNAVELLYICSKHVSNHFLISFCDFPLVLPSAMDNSATCASSGKNASKPD